MHRDPATVPPPGSPVDSSSLFASLVTPARVPLTPDYYYSNYDCKVRPGGRVQQIWNTLPRYSVSAHAGRDYFSTV